MLRRLQPNRDVIIRLIELWTGPVVEGPLSHHAATLLLFLFRARLAAGG